MAFLRNSFTYDASPTRVWAMVTDFDALARVCAPYLHFEGLPDGRVRDGQRAEVQVRVFGRLPPQPYHMEIVECDDAAMRFRSHEIGAGVRRWNHTLWLEPEGTGTRLCEEIDIDAGLLTPLFLLWARILYHGRHKPRRDLLTSGAF